MANNEAIIERAYVEKDDLFHGSNEDKRFDSNTMEHIFDDICDVANLLDYDD